MAILLSTAEVLALLLAVTPLALYLYFSLVRHNIVVERVAVQIDRPMQWSTDARVRGGGQQLEIVHLSDFHYDFGLERRNDAILDEILRGIDEVRPDLILLTGDYVNKNPAPVERFCRVFVDKLRNKSRLGVFATLGNHDSYGESDETPSEFGSSADYIASSLEGAGVKVLRNQMIEVGTKVFVCGLEDIWNPSGWRGHRRAMRELHNKEEGCLRIVMSHNPDTADALREYRYDLQLSGHAHGGQICFPSFVNLAGRTKYNVPVLGQLRPIIDWSIPRIPMPVLGSFLSRMRRKRKYAHVIDRWEWAQGLHVISGGSSDVEKRRLYVTRGVGTHRNMRLFCPPEMTVLTLAGREDGQLDKKRN